MNLEKLELSTQLLIAEARQRGIEVEILDAEENFIALRRDGRTEYVKQATRTSADTYISALLMENKEVTKKVLRTAGMLVPAGGKYRSMPEALEEYPAYQGKKIVVKPNSTNFGEGVAILESDAELSAYRAALETAFALDASVLVEEFVEGREYRFLVIGGLTRAVLHRIPANVRGDGRATIRELVEAKNRHPYRGEGYRKPLERIRLEAVELAFLSGQGLTPENVPAAGTVVFLRKNSNISTGGDSLDLTDTMPSVYRAWAEKATAVVGAAICGLDMIIPDVTAEGADAAYSILELNFNPALHIHAFPAEGKNRHVERHVLDLLGFR
ncbi:MAG: bifunctional glutamate--cysteine ligase GshA/glutathione synthetase GshB [Opitutaceae bacterium]|nr:bifunctional glutamate--cysteine ligase GshA/glutathione synthetase GshB [Opitutaceae bacterium]